MKTLILHRDNKKSSIFKFFPPPGDCSHDEVQTASKQIIERQSYEEAEVTSNVHQKLHVAKHWI